MMRGWVGPAPLAAMPYNVACVNGHRLRGERTEGYQALRCPSCGEAVFILPRSPLPEPPVSAAPKRNRQAADVIAAYPGDDAPHALVDPPGWTPPPAPRPPGRSPQAPAQPEVEAEAEAEAATDDAVADIDWVDAGPPAAPSRPEPAARPGAAAPGRPQAPRAAAPPRAAVARPAASPPVVEPAPIPVASRPTWREWAATHRNSLLAAALVALVLGAVTVKRWRQRLEELPRIAEIGRTEGFKKLDSGDFFAAKKILADASAAVDALGGRFEGADAIRQGAREAAIFTDLVPRTLEDLVEEAATYRDVNGWSAHFRAMYQGRSILLETTITAVPDPARPGSRYQDAYRILVGRGSKPEAQGRIDFTGFELFDLAQPKVGEIKLVGARLASLEFNVAENLWFCTLEPDSGVFMTHTQALEALHWPTAAPAEEPQP